MKIFAVVFLITSMTWASPNLNQITQRHIPSGSDVYLAVGQQPALQRGDIQVPASVAKIFTSEMVRIQLGLNFQFTTQVEWSPSTSDQGVIGNLTLIGEGDPEFSVENLIRQLRSKGVHTIVGDIQIIDTIERVKPLDHREITDSGRCYNAVSQALNMNGNCTTLRVSATRATIQDPDLDVSVQDRVDLQGQYINAQPRFFWDDESVHGFRYQAGGSLPNSNTINLEFVVPDTTQWIINKIVRLGNEAGIQFRNLSTEAFNRSISRMELPSLPAAGFTCQMLQSSQNMYADALFRILPSDERNSFLSRFGEVRLVEGAGMSRVNRTPGEAVMSLLDQILQSEEAMTFYDQCFAKPGAKNTTLEKRMTSIRGNMIAKTGSLGGMSHLAGFIRKDADSEWIPFVFLLQNRQKRVRELRRMQDKVMVDIFNQL